MKLSVNSQRLAEELRPLARVVPSKPAIPIMSHALLTASDGGNDLQMSATDYEVSLTTGCFAHVADPGVAALPVAKFLALVEQFPNADVSIEATNGQVTVKCGSFTSRMQALSALDFPTLPDVEGTSCVLDAAQLRQLIARTRYAINANGSSYVMKGALLALKGPGGAMVATDAKRLALSTIGRTGPDVTVIVPVKALDMLQSLPDGDVELTAGERHLFFRYGTRLLMTRTIDGQFPAYERIIPANNSRVATVDRQALAAALRRINLVSEDNRAVYFALTPDQLELTTSSAEVGTAHEVLPASFAGQLKVCINGGCVLDFLDAASGRDVEIKLQDERSAALLMDGDDHLAVIMLLRYN